MFFSVLTYGQSNQPKLTVNDLESLFSMNLMEKESFLNKLQFVSNGKMDNDDKSITTFKFEYGSMSTSLGQLVNYSKRDGKEIITYVFSNFNLYEELKKSFVTNGYTYNGDDDAMKNNGLSYSNSETGVTVRFIIHKVDNIISNQKDNMYILTLQNF